jgi:23S rRNA-/tRNA-specific pseudouridylate synthase
MEGFRADRALAALLGGVSRRAAKVLFRSGRIRLNGRVADGSERVRAGDQLLCPDPAAAEGAALLQASGAPRLTTRHGRQVNRIYEDKHLLVISKPAEVLVHPHQDGRTRRETLEEILARAYPAKPGPRAQGHAWSVGDDEWSARPEPVGEEEARGFYFVHRLDLETSGCLLVAKSPQVRDQLIRAFQERRVGKEYLAVVVGEAPWESKVSRRPITYRQGDRGTPRPKRLPSGEPDWVKMKKHGLLPGRTKRGVALPEGDRHGKPCETTFDVEERFRGYTLVRCRPRTGRLHQIRVHLAAEGFPLAYDALYGRRSPLRLREFSPGAAESDAGDEVVLNRLPLHALRLSFQHPVTGQRLELEAPLPRDLKEFLRVLRKFRRM